MGDSDNSLDICMRTFDFAVRIVKLCHYLNEKPGISRILSSQLLRAGTSIGANVEDSPAGQSRADFINRYDIALKEARETHYWLRLLIAAEIVPEARLAELLNEADELARIIGAIVVSANEDGGCLEGFQ
jgi:four helix bundle protein